MAPVQQLGVLAFASAVLAVPHAQWQPFKRHAHASAPPAYESSYVPNYAGPSSVDSPVSSSAPAVYASSTSSWAAPVSSSGAPAPYGSSSSSWAAPVSSAGAYGSSSSVSAAAVPSGSAFPACWSTCFSENGSPSESELCGNEAVSTCICDTCSPDEDAAYKSWLAGYCSAASSSSAGPVSSAPPYPIPSGYSGHAAPTGGYGSGAWGSTGAFPSYSVCTETSTLIYRSTTAYSTYYVTHTIYASAASSAAAQSGAPGYGGSPAGSAPAYNAVPASSAAPAGYSGAPAGSAAPAGYSGAPAGSAAPAGGESCVPDVTVTTTVQTTVYVTAGAAPSGGAAPSYGGGAPSSAAAPSYPAGSAAPSYGGAAPSGGAPSYSGAPSAPSSAAPAPSYSGGGGLIGKRGIAYNDANLANTLAGGAAGGWAYNWLSDSSGLDSSIPYIPMLWGPTSDFTPTWEANAKAGIAAGVQYLFSFNEPDMSSQANLSPAAAAAAWKQYMEPFAGQAKLVAPSVTNGQSTGLGLSWLQEFFDACTGCTIDAVAQHWYFPTNDVQNFKDQITQAAQIGGGKGVFLSEFGAIGTDQEKSAFLSEVLPWLDSNPDVLGYSYFMVADGSLMTGNSPSTYGETYCS